MIANYVFLGHPIGNYYKSLVFILLLVFVGVPCLALWLIRVTKQDRAKIFSDQRRFELEQGSTAVDQEGWSEEDYWERNGYPEGYPVVKKR